MLFNSFGYMFLFLPVTVLIYFALNGRRLTRAATAWLVFASLFFYSWWNVKYLALIVGSVIFNFAVGTALGRSGAGRKLSISKKAVLTFGIFANITLLGYYKYVDFFISNINTLTGLELALQKIVLPLGISFFTFTQTAYLVDAYYGKAKDYDFLHYTLFVTFFPHLLAGPIIHHKEMMPQFDNRRNRILIFRNLARGLFLFFIGLFKKVVIADALAPVANAGFDVVPILTLVEAWVTSLSYTFQLYFDFSAYTDMALGASLMFNIRLPINFDSPYKATSITDFWRRWHVTLSRFLRDYVYIPLGGNKLGNLRIYRNLLATFLVGGIWHGAGWTFVFWGFLHGVGAVLHRAWTRLNLNMNRVLAWIITFSFVNIAWVFFRARTWNDAIKVLRGMFGFEGIMLSRSASNTALFQDAGISFGFLFYSQYNNAVIYYIFAALLISLIAQNSNELTARLRPNWKTLLFATVVALYTLTNMHKVSEFLYFNF